MDNKQDRQFYWKVKDFLNKKPEMTPTKRNSLSETITSITSLAKPVPVPVNEIVNSASDLKNQTTNILSSYQNKIKSQQPKSVNSSNHITANIFRS